MAGGKIRLTKNITENQFDNGYWYANELKDFAKRIGVFGSGKLRKDELEKIIRKYIRTGEVALPAKNGKLITYADLVNQYIRLNETKGPFEKIPHGRYINFVSAFLKHETGATRKDAAIAWHELKQLDIPRTTRHGSALEKDRAEINSCYGEYAAELVRVLVWIWASITVWRVK